MGFEICITGMHLVDISTGRFQRYLAKLLVFWGQVGPKRICAISLLASYFSELFATVFGGSSLKVQYVWRLKKRLGQICVTSCFHALRKLIAAQVDRWITIILEERVDGFSC